LPKTREYFSHCWFAADLGGGEINMSNSLAFVEEDILSDEVVANWQ
jgi:hypothetical protein